MKDYYEILGLDETATDEEVRARYESLKAKYKEEQWQDGEAGNEAAKMLNKLETAYVEIREARKERSQNTEGQSSFEEISMLLKENRISEAQAKLDDFNERSAEWHYLQAVVFYKKNWANESKKQLEIAMQMDPNNTKYRQAYGKLNAKTEYAQQEAYRQQQQQNPYSNPQYGGDQQMGGNACSNCISCCYTYLCIDCLFSLCCGCR
jgi:tetratricopeptide (TPR) repeat protein